MVYIFIIHVIVNIYDIHPHQCTFGGFKPHLGLQALTLVGPTRDNPVFEPLAVLDLNNRVQSANDNSLL